MTRLLFPGLALLLAGCEPAERWLPPVGFVGDPDQGQALFSPRCSQCHGASLGGTASGPPLIHEIYHPDHHSDVAFHLAVRNGVRAHHWHFGDMPAQKGVSPEQVAHIAAWVRQQQRSAGIE